MDRLDYRARLTIVSDLDENMVDHQDPENLSLLRFNALWESEYRDKSLLVFSTERTPTSYEELRNRIPVLTPDIIIMSVGTVIAYGDKMVPDEKWVELLNHNWDRNVVLEETSKFPQLIYQPEMNQGPHKVSFDVSKEKAQEVINPLLTSLEERGLEVKIIYSGGITLDVLPKMAGKGEALWYLFKQFALIGKPPIKTLICGYFGYDAELFTVPSVYGVVVSNAKEELLAWYEKNVKMYPNVMRATERCANGIIQAIGQFNLGPSISLRDTEISFLRKKNYYDNTPACALVKFYLLCERWFRAEIEKSETTLIWLKSITHESGVIVHPSGVENSLHEAINSCYGIKKGKLYRIWLDKVLIYLIRPGCWIVRFNKWEINGDSKLCCNSTVLLNYSGELRVGFRIVHMRHTCFEGAVRNNPDLYVYYPKALLQKNHRVCVEPNIETGVEPNTVTEPSQRKRKAVTDSEPRKTRRGRTTRKPSWHKDYAMN